MSQNSKANTITVTLRDVAKMIDHSLLHPTMTDADILDGLRIAKKYNTATACIKPYSIPLAKRELESTGVLICPVIGFPHGNSTTEVKVFEADAAAAAGGQEIDMVINIGKALGGDWDYVSDEIRQVNDAVTRRGAALKVIFENDFLQEGHIIKLCDICSDVGVAFVKTSTGYGFVKQDNGMYTYKGATVPHLKLMKQSCKPGVQIKAAGGVRTLDDLLHVMSLGVTRIGATATVAIMEEAVRRGISDQPAESVMTVLFLAGRDRDQDAVGSSPNRPTTRTASAAQATNLDLAHVPILISPSFPFSHIDHHQFHNTLVIQAHITRNDQNRDQELIMSDPSSSAAQPQAVTESTPLLGPQATRDDLAVPSPQHAPDEERAVGADGGEPGGENNRPRRKWTLILTILSVVFSSSALILYLGVQVLQAIDYHYLGYRTIVAMNFSAVLSFVALICSSFNFHGLRRHGVASMPLGINIIVDILVFVYIFFPVLDALYENISNVFGPIEIVIFVYLLIVLFLSLVHLILLVMRTVAAFRARRGTQTRWSIPTGQLTFEFTIKLLRQEVLGRSSPETVQPAAAQGDVQRQS